MPTQSYFVFAYKKKVRMDKKTAEWLSQSDYDMDTADFMYQGGRYFYAVFMCHMSIEKALKGLYYEKRREIPPKVHNLLYLLNKIGIRPPTEVGKMIVRLNEANIATRYPEELSQLQKAYTETVVKEILSGGKEVIQWIKMQF